jgi:hypothetical protein
MSLASDLLHPFSKLEDAVKAIVLQTGLESRNNGGVLPTQRVYKSIDGRNGIPSHERFDMPFWGTTFQHEGEDFTPASEAEVRARIMNIVGYVKSIQQK